MKRILKPLFMLCLVCSLSVGVWAQEKPAYTLFDKEGNVITYGELVDRLTQYDVVFLGEMHNCPITHWLEYEGLITDDRFEAETRLWDNYYTDYRAVVWLAKEHGIPFIATNVPRRYANSVKNGGLEALEAFSEEARRYIAPLPIPFEYDEGKSREAFGMMLMMGGKTAGDLRLLAEAQAVKDATMAWFISRHLDGKFLHLNGSYHSDFKEGIIPYLLKYRPETTFATVTFLRTEDISRLGEEQKGRADFYVCIPETMVTSY